MSAGFWAKVEKSDGCWDWTGYRTATGYGRVQGTKYAHRVAYELEVGLIPEGMEIDHLCRNRGCVNPAHLEVVTHRENQLRGDSPPGANARKTHCPRGHEYTEENTRVYQGHRMCRHCRRDDERARRGIARMLHLGVILLAVLALASPARAHWRPNTPHNRIHAINHAFCGQVNGCWLGNEALRVAYCESGPSLWPYAKNGQYLGMFQFGAWARSTFGFAWNPWEQARAAQRYYRHSGWSGWACKP